MLITNQFFRNQLKDKHRIVVKVGSSSLVHKETGELDLLGLEHLVRVLADLRNQGKDVILVSSGAIGVGRKALGFDHKPETIAEKQACASVGQAQLITIYQKLFSEYNQIASQVLMTKHTIVREKSYINARNTFGELIRMGVIPIVNENDTVSTDEIEIGDNDTLSAVVAAITGADLLIILSDIDGLYTDDPAKNKDATFIECVTSIDDSLYELAKGAGSDLGTGGMKTKIDAARIANDSGCDMIVANGSDFHIIGDILGGQERGTLFLAHKSSNFNILDYIEPETIKGVGRENIQDFRQSDEGDRK